MQAITLAIGKSGVTFFAQHYLAGTLSNLLSQMHPPNKTVRVPDFTVREGIYLYVYNYSNVLINLTNGGLQNFTAVFQQVTQGVTNDGKNTPIFTIGMQAQNFQASYDWNEGFHYDYGAVTAFGEIPFWIESDDASKNYRYAPGFGLLNVSIVVQFLFDPNNNQWEITVESASPSVSGISANIPAQSILQGQNNLCFGSHVDDATAQAIDSIDFVTPTKQLISDIVGTIPGSGDLGGGIVYDFSLGDSGLLFPNNDGIQMGVKGGASYNGAVFSETPEPSLPLPVPPADNDAHHLNMYVSNYEIDALYWAFFKARKLNLEVKPSDLPDPTGLKVATYTALETSLTPYTPFMMFANITQNVAPTTSFQTVYLFTLEVMAFLQQQLPANVYQLVLALGGMVFLSKSDLETFLQSAWVPASDFDLIEKAGQTAAMVLTQSMNFNLQIQNNQPTLPQINFSVQRVDVLIQLGLGLNTHNNQTLQYNFANAANTATFINSNIPNFAGGQSFRAAVWPLVAESMYAQNLATLGKIGAPLPIMQGFQFDFINAAVSVHQGYVSILANVLYINS